MNETERLAEIRQNLIATFDEGDLHTLCFDLGVDYDVLSGDNKAGKARELLALLNRTGRIRELIVKLSGLRPHIQWREILAATEAESPYQGLKYFDVADASRFFGRASLIAQLVGRLRISPNPDPPDPSPGEPSAGRFLAIVGASGSGKSSLARAGIVAALQRDEPLADGTRPPPGFAGRIFIITPTAHPLESLAASLTRGSESVTATATLMDDLSRDGRSLHLYARRLVSGNDANARLLILVDQFEELFTACKNPDERKAFVDNLLTAVGGEGGPVTVILTLRADFYAQAAVFDNLRALLAKYQDYIGPMTPDELRRAIEEPARRNGWTLEPGLADLVLKDAGGEPGALPLLSHALLRTWQLRRGRTLTLQGYTESGGLHGAIRETAQEVYQSLSPGERRIAQRIFMQVTELGEDAPDTRRRASLAELVGSDDETTVRAVLKHLADARLITTDETTSEGETTEVAHEALIREWPQLRAWLDENREQLRLQRQIAADAAEWVRLKRDTGALYRGVRLAQALEFVAQPGASVGALARAFVQASQALADQEQAEREAQRQRELAAANRLAEEQRRRAEAEQQRAMQQVQNNRRLRQRAFLLLGALILSLLLAIAAGLFAQQATQQRDMARSRELAARSLSKLGSELDLSLLLGIEVYRMTHMAESKNALLSALQYSPMLSAFARGHAAIVFSVAFSPDGKTLAAGTQASTILLWDVSDPKRPLLIGPPLTGHTALVSSVAFAPDGKTLASASADKTIRLWDVSDPKSPVPIGAPLSDPRYYVESLAFSPDGKTLASAGADNTIQLWDVSNLRSPVLIGAPPSDPKYTMTSLAFASDGKTLAAGSSDATIHLWDVSNPKRPLPIGMPLTGHRARVTSVAFAPDGKTLASASTDRIIILWDVSNPKSPVAIGTPLTGHTNEVTSLAFASDGKTLASGSADDTIRLWDVSNPKRPLPIGMPLTGHRALVTTMAFAPDGRTLASGSEDETILLWDVSAPSAPESRILSAMPLTGHTDAVTSVAFAPDGRTLASGSRDNTILLWDVSNPKNPVRIGSPLTGHTSYVLSVAFAPDGKTLASGSWDQTIRLWDVSNPKRPVPIGTPLTGHTNGVRIVAFAPDGKTLASASDHGAIRLWDVSNPKRPVPIGALLTGDRYQGTSLAFAPDGKTLAAGTVDTTILLWDVSNLQNPVPIDMPRGGHKNYVESLAFAPDGKTLATGSVDTTIRLWDMSNPKRPVLIGTPLSGHTNGGISVAFAPDGKTLASGSWDQTIRLWDVSNPKSPVPIGTPLTGYRYQAMSLAFAPDGKTLASGDSDNTIRLWDVDPESWHQLACHIANRNLTPTEWLQYFPDDPYHKTCPELSDP